jgi:hypothetical protein
VLRAHEQRTAQLCWVGRVSCWAGGMHFRCYEARGRTSCFACEAASKIFSPPHGFSYTLVAVRSTTRKGAGLRSDQAQGPTPARSGPHVQRHAILPTACHLQADALLSQHRPSPSGVALLCVNEQNVTTHDTNRRSGGHLDLTVPYEGAAHLFHKRLAGSRPQALLRAPPSRPRPLSPRAVLPV